MTTAVNCLQQPRPLDEIDDFREAVIDRPQEQLAPAGDGRPDATPTIEHYGFIVAGKFYRGNHRGGGRFVSTMQRDRVRALQLMQQALTLTAKEDRQGTPSADFHLHFADMLLNGAGYHEPWRLQYLTDLSQLPDYEEGYSATGTAATRGAPVDAEGNPVYHQLPKSYEAAAERRRALALDAGAGRRVRPGPRQRSRYDVRQLPARASSACRPWPSYGWHFRERRRRQGENKSGTFALHTLSDDETIARLATGIKRFKLPDEFNWIKIYERVAGRGKSQPGRAGPRHAGRASTRIAGSTSRPPTPGRRPSRNTAPGHDNYRQQRLDQIVGNWGRFETGADAAGRHRTPSSTSASATATRSPSRPTRSRSPSCSTT